MPHIITALRNEHLEASIDDADSYGGKARVDVTFTRVRTDGTRTDIGTLRGLGEPGCGWGSDEGILRAALAFACSKPDTPYKPDADDLVEYQREIDLWEAIGGEDSPYYPCDDTDGESYPTIEWKDD